ncbi:hypothetical protein K504DRAFT_507750 [Pleomassaria siparia CBS 279.74]|uniref:Xylanolytic transcriptional activator regulatory domain-containing protein n=1 Tax=Pleomassaria siparia CBS 279.74 TaxID=1314801 RepID=A0A6G1JUE1_9PLEO|nr:hypothetical protein K504DRAFT_507750 [Pleomassaria siparia CBS 279.74]
MQDDGHSQFQYPGAGQYSKVAIPRLKKDDNEQIPATSEKRVIKACTNCRKRSGSGHQCNVFGATNVADPSVEVKCTGEVPRCKSCEAADLPCIYEQARRDRLKTANDTNHVLIALLKDLGLRVSDDDKKKIDATIEAVEDDVSASRPATSSKAHGKRPRKESPSDEDIYNTQVLGEALAPASVGSNEDLDLLDEDLLRSRESRETGFVGQNSEIQWLRSLQRQMGNPGDEPLDMPYGPPGKSTEAKNKRISAMHERRKSTKQGNIQHVADSSFYLDSDSLEVETMLDPYELPDPDMAERLFGCYMETVHAWFPILPDSFEDQFYRYVDSMKRQQRYQVPEKWQAVLNLVFAIGAQYSYLTDAAWRGEDDDHLLYMTRAVRILGVKDTVMILSAPDLGLIQASATGLLSFYYLVIGHVSRAWVMIGISLRFALAVGLHLRNEDPQAPQDKKESSVRIWWSLHSVECLLSSITGRPCIIANEDCTVPLPQILPETKDNRKPSRSSRSSRGGRYEYSTTSSGTSPTTSSGTSEAVSRSEGRVVASPFLHAHIEIGLTTRKVLKKLYSARTSMVSWESIQSYIASLRRELDLWATSALSDAAESPHLGIDSHSDREKILLGFHYHSMRILITRPCLCRLERRIHGQSHGSSNFNQRMAEDCVQSAQNLTLLLPDHPDPVYMYQKGPWWCLVHNIMQAMAVFLLEMLYHGTHLNTRDNEDVPKCIKKLLRWLRAMRNNNPVAGRAYKLIVNILKSGETRVQADITDLLAEDEADIDRGHLFQTYPVPLNPSNPNPTPTGGFASSAQWQQNYYDPAFVPLPDPYFLMDQFQMPSSYGNPFLTNFDQGNPINLNVDDLWRNEGDEENRE